MRWLRVSVIGLLVLGMSACDGSGSSGRTSARPHRTPTTTAAPTTTTTEPAGDPLPLQWTPCGGGTECATLTVPLDYAHPRAATIPISLKRQKSSDPAARIGSLVINPGGPGEAGTQLLGRDLGALTPGIRQRFDVVEMDPRGVGNSGGLRCNDGGANAGGAGTGAKVDPIPTTPEARAALINADRGYAQACAQHAGALLAHMGTTDVARDLEQLRKALGDEKLTFLGMSYGTLLGATYADLFPTHLRALVLDGVIDPAMPTFELWMAQAVGFQQQLDAFFASCAGGCAWRPGIPLPDALDRLTQRIRTQPLNGGGGSVVGVSELYTALFSRLYSRSRWSSLAAALGAAERGDGGPLLSITRSYLGETPGSTINSDASNAINCLDHPVETNLDSYDALAAQAATRARHFGPYLAWAGVMCATWKAPPTREPHPVTAPGAPPTLVIGTTSDPATPYPWAQSVASALQQGVLLTRQGTGHVALLSSSCVRRVVETYLVNVAPPAPGAVCS
ncbi:MAG: alpha/beta hydrolase [Acidimicrobiia bacterium]